jgi:hypothetical protein
MLKLYRTRDGVTEYWEAWEESGSKATLHWGKLGEKGESREVSSMFGTSASKLIERESKPLWAAGYKPVSDEQMAQVVIQFKIDGMGTKLDMDREQLIEGLMNECLGWTGLGNCDGHDIGSGTLNIFCDVVDGPASEQIVIDCLKENRQLDGAVIALRERVGDESYIVFWPKDFVGEFDLI